jgi:hypothetical protein
LPDATSIPSIRQKKTIHLHAAAIAPTRRPNHTGPSSTLSGNRPQIGFATPSEINGQTANGTVFHQAGGNHHFTKPLKTSRYAIA